MSGEDPLKPYGDVELRNWQVRRVMDFPHAGDLMVISTVYPDGTVAALEELIGSHGGMGGEQTDAFMFHPADMEVGETRNSIDVFDILNARRGLPDVETPPVVRRGAAGRRANLAHGLFHQPSRWVGRALRGLVLDRAAYSEVADDSYMTGPALLIMLLGLLIATIFAPNGWSWASFAGRVGGWLLGVVVLVIAARPLGGRGGYTRTLRSVGFGAIAHFLSLLAVIPPIKPLAVFLSLIVTFFATWIGAVEAQKLARLARPGAADRGDCRVRHRYDCRAGAVRRRCAHAPVAGGRVGPGAVRMNDAGQVVTPALSGFRCLPHACGRINQRVGGLREQGAIHNAVVFRRALRIRSGGHP